MKYLIIISAFMMHLIVFSYASAPLSDCAEEGKQTAAKAWVKANYKPPTKFILSALDSVVPDISAEFDDIRGKARSLSEQPKVYEIVLSVEERIRKEIFGYIEALKVKAAERILHIWQENLEGSVIEDESSYPSDLPTVVASGDEKPSPLGRPAPLRKIDGPPSPIRRDVRSSPTGYSPKAAADAAFTLQRQKTVARNFVDSEWDNFSGFPVREICVAVNRLPSQFEQRAKAISIPDEIGISALNIIMKANAEICGYMRALATEADKKILQICEEAKESLLS